MHAQSGHHQHHWWGCHCLRLPLTPQALSYFVENHHITVHFIMQSNVTYNGTTHACARQRLVDQRESLVVDLIKSWKKWSLARCRWLLFSLAGLKDNNVMIWKFKKQSAHLVVSQIEIQVLRSRYRYHRCVYSVSWNHLSFNKPSNSLMD